MKKVSKKVYKDKAGKNTGFTKVTNTTYLYDPKKDRGTPMSWNPLTGEIKKVGK